MGSLTSQRDHSPNRIHRDVICVDFVPQSVIEIDGLTQPTESEEKGCIGNAYVTTEDFM